MQDRQIDQLLQLIATGDNDAFETLYRQTSRGVFAFVYSYLKNYQDSEDALQTVYIKVKLNVSQYKQGTNARAWMLQIAKNTALNELKKRKPLEQLTVDIPQNDSSRKMDITDIINKILDEDERQIVVLHVLWGYKHREIAQILNCPTGTVTSKYKRSVQKMKQALKEAAI